MSDKFVLALSIVVLLLLMANSPNYALQTFGSAAISSLSEIVLVFFGFLRALVAYPLLLVLAIVVFYQNKKQVSSFFGGNLALWCIAAFLLALIAI